MKVVSNDMALFWAFTSMLVFGIGLTLYMRFAWGRPTRRRRRHA